MLELQTLWVSYNRRLCWRVHFVLLGAQQLPARLERSDCWHSLQMFSCYAITHVHACALLQGKGLTPATRQSLRLQKVDAEDTGLTDFPDEGGLHSGNSSRTVEE